MPPFSRRDFLKLLGLSPLLFAPRLTTLPTSPPRRTEIRAEQASQPNILILVFDALTARNMGLYGYPRQNTPNLERFAQKSLFYHRHHAGGNFTVSGTASLLTGAYPWQHRAIRGHSTAAESYAAHNLFGLLSGHYRFAYTHNAQAYFLLWQARQHINQLLRASDLCLFSDTPADSLFDRDYTSAYLGELLSFRNGTNPSGSLFLHHLDRIYRNFRQDILDRAHLEDFPRGLPSHYDVLLPSFLVFTLEQVVDWLDAQVQNVLQPFMGYVHVLPPHAPYVTRREFFDVFIDDWQPPVKPLHYFQEGLSQESLNLARRFYDEDIAYADAEFGRLYDLLERSGALDNTILIVTSDHGEMFERGIFTHVTATMYEPLLHIPLLIHLPGQTERQDIHDLTSAVDLLPTLLNACGQPVPPGCAGEVLPGFLDAAPTSARSIYALESKSSPKNDPTRAFTIAQLKDRYKLVYYKYPDYSDVYELYDLLDDPEELVNLYSPTDSIASAMKNELERDTGIQLPP